MSHGTADFSTEPAYGKLPRLSLVLMLVSLLLGGYFVERANDANAREHARAAVLQELGLLRARLEGQISTNLQTVQGLVAAIQVEPDMDQARFEQFARPLFNGAAQLRNIGAAPDMIIRLMYPLEGNERAVGLDLGSNPAQRFTVERARDQGELVVAGPVDLVQGGKGFIGRIPVFLTDAQGQETFWGIVSAVIDAEDLYRSAGLMDPSLDINIALRGRDGSGDRGDPFFGDPLLFRAHPVETDVTLPGGSWQLVALPKGGWPRHADNLWQLRLLMLVAGLLILLPTAWAWRLMRRNQEQSTRLRGLFTLSPVGIALNEFEGGRFLDGNDALASALGYRREDLKNLDYWDITPKDYDDQESQQLESLRITGRYGPYDKEYIRRDGSRFPVRLNGMLIRDANGRELIWSIVEDLSGRQKAERQLEESRQHLELVIDSTGVGIWDWDIPSGLTIFNEHWARMLGYSLSELAPVNIDTWTSRCHPEDAVRSGELLQEHWRGETDHYECRSRMRHRDGHWVWVQDTGRVVEWLLDGRPWRMVGTRVDISAQVKAAQEQEDVARHNRVLAELTVNPAVMAGELTGARDLLVRRMAEALQVHRASLWLFEEGGAAMECVAQFDASEPCITRGARIATADCPAYFAAIRQNAHLSVADALAHPATTELLGTYLKPLGVVSLLDAVIGSGDRLVGVICAEHRHEPRNWRRSEENFMLSLSTLISGIHASEQRREARLQLEDALDAAQAAARAKSEFLATMSHEIRTPMNGVLGMLNLLQRSQLDQDQRRKVSVARSSAESLLTLLNDILDFSKVDAGKLELELVDFDLCALLASLAEGMMPKAQEKGLELVLDLTGIHQTMVKGDPGRLRQVLVNLVGNAIKFTPAGEIVIRVALEPQGDQMLVKASVRDTGIGMDPARIAELFEPFTQSDASTTRVYGGTGLGLAICRQICRLMQGDISATSQPGVGSEFSFHVLLQPSQRALPLLPQRDPGNLSVLVVDDNATNREVLRQQLGLWGATVVEASSGADALALCEARVSEDLSRSGKPFDIAILDMMMPQMDGAALGRAFKADKRFAGMALVMMTSIGHRGDARRLADIGFVAYFPKPVTATDLLAALDVVADGGAALAAADPLVTRHYMRDLQAATPEHAIPWPDNTRLLLVEDNAVNQEVARLMLEDIGLITDVAGDGREALQILSTTAKGDAYTLILMDCQMPELDGFETTRQIRAGKGGSHHQWVPVIALTANAMKGDRENCLAAGMNDYLSKPVDPAQLQSKLRCWLLGQVETVETTASAPAPVAIGENLLAWNHAAALAMLKGRYERLQALLRLFCENAPERLARLQQALQQGDLKQVAAVAHSFKGSLGQLHAQALHALAAELEAAASAADAERVNTLGQQLLDAIPQWEARLEAFLATPQIH